MQPTPRCRIFSEGPGVHTLLIPEITGCDLGTYIVRINNKYGQAESSCSVSELIHGLTGDTKHAGTCREQRPPTFVREPPEMFCLRCGDDLIFDCHVEGWPQPAGIAIII